MHRIIKQLLERRAPRPVGEAPAGKLRGRTARHHRHRDAYGNDSRLGRVRIDSAADLRRRKRSPNSSLSGLGIAPSSTSNLDASTNSSISIPVSAASMLLRVARTVSELLQR